MSQQADHPGSSQAAGGKPAPEITSGRWQKIKDLFSEALELDGADRKAFLDQACDGDQSLHREVESLLAASESAVDRTEPAPELDRMIGRRLGAYEVLKLVATGGMAAVYLAIRADDQYRKRVAIKIIHPGLEKEAVCRRFRNERQTLAALDHPNIVKLLDGGTTEEGLPYLVMDYVEGQPIDDYCDRHKLAIERRLRLFLTVCGAVDHAHQNLVIHRDLKPGNILVTAEGTPKLLDFGIAKLLNPEYSAQDLFLTQPGMHHMTPAYASPEQVRGDTITCASDIYSLGVVLYELLTGHRPYRFKSYAPAELERVICETEAERPSTAVTRVEMDKGPEGSSAHLITPDSVSRTREEQPGKLRRRLKGDLDNIVLKALHKEPKRRYGSVQEFSGDIGRHLENLPVKARHHTLSYRVSRFVTRHKVEVVAGFTVLLLLGAMAELASRSKKGSSESDSIAVLRFTNTSADPNVEYLADGIPATIIQDLSQIPNLRVIAVRLKPEEQPDPPAIGRNLRVRKVLTGKILQQNDTLHLQVDLVDADSGAELWGDQYVRRMSELLVVQNQVSRQVSEKLRGKLSGDVQSRLTKRSTESTEAYQLFLKGRHSCEQRNAEGFRRGLEYVTRAIQKDPQYGLAYAEFAACLSMPAYYGAVPPQAAYPKARDAAMKALQLDDSLAEAHEALATILQNYDWDWAGSEKEYQRAIELDPNYFIARSHYAMHLGFLGRHQEAIVQAREGQSRDPMSSVANAGLAWAFMAARQPDQCLQQAQTAMELDPKGIFPYISLVLCYDLKHEYVDATRGCQRAIELGGPPPLFMGIMGYSYGALSNKKEETEKILKELQGMSQHSFVSPTFLAMVYAGLNEKDRALAELERAYKTRETVLIGLEMWPPFDNLRSEPRFQDLERKVGVLQ